MFVFLKSKVDRVVFKTISPNNYRGSHRLYSVRRMEPAGVAMRVVPYSPDHTKRLN